MGADESPRPRDREVEVQSLRFGPFEMDLRSGELRRNGMPVHIQPQPFKVLALLVSRAGDVVTREELQVEVWPVGTFVDFEQSLNFCIRQIRTALGDQAVAPRYVETLPRRGYRWIGGAVETIPASAAIYAFPRPGAPSEPTADSGVVRPSPLRRPWIALGVIVGGLALVGAVSWFSTKRHREVPPPAFQRVTFRRGCVTAARFGPENQVIYTAAWEGRAPALHVARPDPRDTRVVDIKVGRVVGVSDSGEVAFMRQGALYRAPLSGGPPKAILEDVVAADWTRDGTDFAVVRMAGKQLQVEFPVAKALGRVERASRIRISPDGQLVALTQHPMPGDDRGSVLVMDRQGRRVAESKDWASVDGLAWSADGREVWFTAAKVGADSALNALDLRNRVRTPLASMGRLILHDIAPDGRVLLERSTSRAEVLFRTEKDTTERDLSWLDYSAAEGLSGDGSLLLFFESGEGGGAGYTTFFRRTDGSLPVRLGSGLASGLSPDGRWALTIPLDQASRVDVLPTGAGEPHRIEIPGGVVHEWATWLGNGAGVLVQTLDTKTEQRSVWRTEADGSAPRRLAVPEGVSLADAVFQPDGERYALGCSKDKIASNQAGGAKAAGGCCQGAAPCVVDVLTKKTEPIRGAEPSWHPVAWDTADRLYFRYRDDKTGQPAEQLFRVDLATGKATLLDEMAPRDRAGVTGLSRVVVSASGDAWVYTAFRRLSDLFVVTDVK